jgi:uncharacterized protein (DUF433 family)
VTTHTESTRGDLGQGLYSLGDLRLFVSYFGDRDDGRKATEWWLPGVLNPVGHRRYQTDYSFSDLISLFVVRELLRSGVKPGAIREAEKYLRRRYGTDRPFVSENLATDGTDVYLDGKRATSDPEQIESASKHGQQAMVEPIRDRLRTVRYNDGEADRWVPATHVVVDPAVQFGEPVIAKTRLPTATFVAAVDRMGLSEAAASFDIAPSAAASVIAFERELATLRSPSRS